MTLTRDGALAAGGGILLAVAGVALALPLLLAAAGALFVALALPDPAPPRLVRREVGARVLARRSATTVRIELAARSGWGTVEIEQPLPPDAQVVEGSNVVAVGSGGVAVLEMRVRFPSAGLARLPPVRVVAQGPLGLRSPRVVELGDEETIEVVVTPAQGRLAAGAATRRGRPGQGPARSLLGPEGEELRAVRRYAPGDPLRRVNWKATARAQARDPGAAPLVNEPDRQGRRMLWVVVDGHEVLDAPTGDGRVLDAALEAAARILEDAAAAGDEVGLVAGGLHLPPTLGRRGLARRTRELARMEPGHPITLPPVRRQARVILITRLPLPRPDVEEAVARLAARGARVTVLDVEGPPGLPPEPGAEARRRVVAAGARLVPWRHDRRLEVAA